MPDPRGNPPRSFELQRSRFGYSGLGRFRSSGARLTPLQVFASWFLSSGFWDTDGRWYDNPSWNASTNAPLDPGAPFGAGWFLADGKINILGAWNDFAPWGNFWFLARGGIDLFGQWDDTKPWVNAPVGWFLADGAINVLGFWDDTEVWVTP